MRASGLRAGIAAAVAVGAVVTLTRCSFLVGSFNECRTSADCAADRICEGNFCIKKVIPDGCDVIADGGVGTTYGPDAGDLIHFGTIAPFTSAGALSATRVQHLNALEMAVDEINQRGIAGKQLVLHVCDSANNSGKLTDQLNWMINTLHVPAVILPTSGAVLTVASITNAHGVLLMSPTATSSEITSLPNDPDGGERLIWRTAPSDAIQGKVIADLLLGTSTYDAGISTVNPVGVLYENGPYGQGLESLLLTRLAATRTVNAFPYTRAGTDYPSAVSGLAATNPQLTVLISFPEDTPKIIDAGTAFASLRHANGHRWFLTDSAKDPVSLAQAPAGELEGAFGTNPAQGAGAAYTVFRSAFSARYGVGPDSFSFIAHNYDAMYCLALAASYAVGTDGRGPVTGATLSAGLSRLSSGASVQIGPSGITLATTTLEGGGSIDVEGTSGHLNFNSATGEAPSPIELWQIDGGTIRGVTVIDPGP